MRKKHHSLQLVMFHHQACPSNGLAHHHRLQIRTSLVRHHRLQGENFRNTSSGQIDQHVILTREQFLRKCATVCRYILHMNWVRKTALSITYFLDSFWTNLLSGHQNSLTLLNLPWIYDIEGTNHQICRMHTVVWFRSHRRFIWLGPWRCWWSYIALRRWARKVLVLTRKETQKSFFRGLSADKGLNAQMRRNNIKIREDPPPQLHPPLQLH